ncbi:MAG: hypothetical protein JWM16_4242 [Verrucomicrobiales bacterium]|nr:hypothetical protein [Verrucomicrobiales bacterium]
MLFPARNPGFTNQNYTLTFERQRGEPASDSLRGDIWCYTDGSSACCSVCISSHLLARPPIKAKSIPNAVSSNRIEKLRGLLNASIEARTSFKFSMCPRDKSAARTEGGLNLQM